MRHCIRSAAFLVAAALFLLPAVAQAQGTAESVGAVPTSPQTQSESLGGTSLSPFFNLTGTLTLSSDGVGISGSTGTIEVDKPAGASVVKAFLFTANIPGGPLVSGGTASLNGVPIAYDAVVNGTLFSTVSVGRADVTSIVAGVVGPAAPGIVSIPYSESATSTTDGSVLAVVFNDPAAPVSTVSLLFGVQSPAGDNFSVALAAPFDDDETDITMSLGISFGFQLGDTGQNSIIEVNGTRLTSSAGGRDDCATLFTTGSCPNGTLITVGGIGDSPLNPADPNAAATNDRDDDELYTLDPLIPAGATSINVFSQNPSNDDAVFFAGFQFFGATAIVGEGILLTPLVTDANAGDTVQLTASVQDDDGNPVSGRNVDFEVVAGPNTGRTFSAFTDPTGRAFWSFSSALEGTDIIEATFIDSNGDPQVSNAARVNWGTTGPLPDISVDHISVTNNPMRGSFLRPRTKITNNTGGNVTGSLWIECLNPTGTRVFDVRVLTGTLRPFQMLTYRSRILIRNTLAGGTYLCQEVARNPAGDILDVDNFQFTLPPLPPLTASAPLPTASSLEVDSPEAGPNPFREQTTIRYTLADDADVSLMVYDVMGREVANLVSGTQSAGAQSAVLSGDGLPAGTYVWRLAIDGEVTTGRVTLAR